MKSRIIQSLLVAAMAIPVVGGITGCALGNTAIRGETEETLTNKLVPGKTRQVDVLNMWGEPTERSIVEGRETWTYSMADTKFRTYIPLVGVAMGNNGTYSTNLIISFDRSGKVLRHQLVQFRG